MTKEQRELIQSLLSSAYSDKKLSLCNLRKKDDNSVLENIYEKEIKLIEETYKEVGWINCND